MPAGQTSLLTVPVGDAGNEGNYGAVAYDYRIGEYDVTAAQYCQFLNAVAATNSDPYGLWNSGMSTDASGGINCSGSAGDYTYTVKTGHANNPAIYITWYDALRFANWLDNGQQNGNTETGVYTLTGSGPDWTVTVPSAVRRATWAASYGEHWLLESYNEAYKAAFYQGGGTNAGYWTFATRSNTQPTSQAPPGGSNSANYCDSTTGFAVTGSYSFNSNQNYLTDVGAYTASPGPYGTFDQDGDAATGRRGRSRYSACRLYPGWRLVLRRLRRHVDVLHFRSHSKLAGENHGVPCGKPRPRLHAR